MIHAYVQGNYVKLDNKNAGVRGESNVTALALHFSPEWSDFSKRLLWKDSRGQKVVSVVLTPVINKDTAAGYPMEYHTEIPYEALAYMGWCSFIVEGFLPNDTAKVAKSVTARMYVQENEAEGDTPENTPAPTPSETQQLQAAVNNAIGAAAADKAAAEQAAAAANAAKTGAETAKAGAEGAAENAGTHEAGAKDAAEKSERAREQAESYTNHPPVPGDNGNWQVWDGEKYVDSGKKAIGKDGTPGYTPVKGKDYFDGAPGYTPQKGVDYFDGAPGYTPVKGKDYFDGTNGVSPTVEVQETENGHEVTITDAEGEKKFEVRDGEGGQVWLTDSEGVPGEIILISTLYKLYGHVEATYEDVQIGDRVIVTSTGAVVEVVDKHEKYGFNQLPSVSLSQVLYYMDGYAGTPGKDGFSPIIETWEMTNGHMVSITTDAAGTVVQFPVYNGDDGFSPVVSLGPQNNNGGTMVYIRDANGEKSFKVLDGEKGDPGFSPTVEVTDINGGHRITVTDAAGKKTFDVLNGAKGASGVSPTVAVEDIDGGHRITITDATGEHTFDVMDGEDGSNGSVNGLIGTSFAAGADMNTLVPSDSNNYEVFYSNATSSTPYVNAPPDRADGMHCPTVIAIRFGMLGMQVAQYYYCMETLGVTDGPCEVWMRKGRYGSTTWTEWQRVNPAPDIHTEIKLQSPGGKVFKVTVDDSGALSAVEVTE